MSKELMISANRHETRVAILEDDQVVEVYHQRENEYSLAGSIHKGRVTRVLPGMQSAFVDIGLDRDAFLYVSDFFEDNEEYDKIVTSVEEKVLKLDRAPSVAPPPAAAAEPGMDEPAPVAAAGPVETPPAMVEAQAPPAMEPRRDDRDRHGRRPRRRRGQKGRGLPESKYYSPRGGHDDEPRPEPRPEFHPEPPPEPPSGPAAPRNDDFFVLPGESLAKYSHTEGNGNAEALDAEEPEDLADDAAEVLAEPPEDLAAEEPDAAIADAPVTPPEVSAAPEPPPPAPLAEEPGTPEAPVATSSALEAGAETAEDVDIETSDAAEPVDTAETQPAEPEFEEDEEPAEGVAGDLAAGPAVEAEGAALESFPPEEEGPEPARIPTSLTAALREQGPRYLHRVSRRMRRRGRDRGPAEADRPAGQRPPEPRPAEAPVKTEERAAARPAESRPDKPAAASISDLLREGQEIIVQIAKEPLGQKGARITSHIALPGRFLVYMPTVDHIGVSRKIPSDDERMRLKRILQTHRTGIPGGYIVRTAGEGRSEEELKADMMFLYNLWLDMRQKAERKPAPALIHHDLNVVERVLRDQLTSAFKNIWVDNEELYESTLRFVQRFQPALVTRVKMYTRTNPMFEEFGVTAELEKALRPKVWLKSGGYIVINQTEALVAIDVNTGKFVGKSNRLEDTIVKTNTDAIKEIVRQIRLRDLGGIIVVDFIDMDERKNRQKVMQALEEAMRADRAPNKILQFNDFGLVAITRKRVKQSLERTLCTPCPYCEGAGYVKSPQTVVGEILQEAHKIARAVEGKDVMLRVAPDVARLLKSNQNTYLQELEEILGRTVIVKSDVQLHQERFDLA
jgi:ribonuclease G